MILWFYLTGIRIEKEILGHSHTLTQVQFLFPNYSEIWNKNHNQVELL